MAFDQTQPTDTTKIRNLGIVIRPNWAAIQTADSSFQPDALNLTDRDAAGLASDPTTIAAASILYSKQDLLGNVEAFIKNGAGDITQMTKGAPTIASSGETTLPGGALVKWGSSSANGNATFGFVADFGLTAFPTNCWMVIAQALNSGLPTVANDYIYTYSPTVNGFGATGVRRITLAATNVFFSWIAIGN